MQAYANYLSLSSRSFHGRRTLQKRAATQKPQPVRTGVTAKMGFESFSNFDFGTATNNRVTNLRDIVVMNAQLWGEQPAELQPNEYKTFTHALSQGTAFMKLLEESEHFRVHSRRVFPNGNYAVRFLMGSPRMEGLDDVRQVTTNVVKANSDMLSLFHSDTGYDVAEIVFPLPGCDTPETVIDPQDDTPQMIINDNLKAIARTLEEKTIHESVVCLMEKGSDDRSTFSGPERVNKYFTGMNAIPDDLLHRGTCTSSSPTPQALEASKRMVQRLWAGGEEVDFELMDEVREKVEGIFCNGEGSMVVHPSGTDAESTPLLTAILSSRAIARSLGRVGDAAKGRVVSVVACAGEVGSGTTEACRGAFFSTNVPLGGNHVKFGQPLPKLHTLADLDAIELVARDPSSGGEPMAEYDALVERTVRMALAQDPTTVVMMHTVAGSKTGLCLPSPGVADRLVAEFGSQRVVSVLDACQMRHGPELIPGWLRKGGPVLMTSSKFYGGPSFGSGVFMPHEVIAEMNAQLEEEGPAVVAAIAEAFASYLTQHDIGDVLPQLRDAMPPGFCNTGVLLRWAAGLHEMEGLAAATKAAGGHEAMEEDVRSWVEAVREEAQQHAPYLEYVPAIDYDSEWQMGGVNTIVAMRLRPGPDEPFLSATDLKKVYAMMFSDLSDSITIDAGTRSKHTEHRIASQRCLLGQPVDIPEGAVLRTCLGAPQLAALVSGRQDLEDMLIDDRVLIRKLALVARQWHHLMSHSL